MHKFIKWILIVIACIIISAVSLLFFQTFGNYAFSIMTAITFLGLTLKIKPKLGNKHKDE